MHKVTVAEERIRKELEVRLRTFCIKYDFGFSTFQDRFQSPLMHGNLVRTIHILQSQRITSPHPRAMHIFGNFAPRSLGTWVLKAITAEPTLPL